jgi:hypothetical protein
MSALRQQRSFASALQLKTLLNAAADASRKSLVYRSDFGTNSAF